MGINLGAIFGTATTAPASVISDQITSTKDLVDILSMHGEPVTEARLPRYLLTTPSLFKGEDPVYKWDEDKILVKSRDGSYAPVKIERTIPYRSPLNEGSVGQTHYAERAVNGGHATAVLALKKEGLSVVLTAEDGKKSSLKIEFGEAYDAGKLIDGSLRVRIVECVVDGVALDLAKKPLDLGAFAAHARAFTATPEAPKSPLAAHMGAKPGRLI